MLAYIPFPAWLRPEIIPGLPFRWYGLMYLVAFVVAYQLVKIQVKQRALEVQRDDVLNLFFWGIVGLLVGARLFYVLIYGGEYFLRNPLQALVPVAREGGRLRFVGYSGMSYHGGLAGTIVASIIYLKVKRFAVWDWGDMIVTGAAGGYTFGRLGNFINGELYGRITTLPWGMIFPGAPRYPTGEAWVQEFAGRIGMDLSGQSMVNLPRHPSQLYEALFEGVVLWAILWFIFRKRRSFHGQLMSIYIIGYGLARFLIEYVRQPDEGLGFPIRLVPLENPEVQFSFLNFTTGQILNAVMIAAGIGCYVWFRHRATRRRDEEAKLAAARPSRRKLRKKLR
ncbi:MAG: prolipoprotein diacylglyceryl transferase [Spirochaetales bacterium]|nr:prolipoprotein diacylglyceryl transferase [Spirochaetales bacterium]